MKKSDELKQKRTALELQIKALAEKAEITDDEKNALRSLHDQVKALNADIELQEKNEEVLKNLAIREGKKEGEEKTIRDYSFAKAIRDIVVHGKLEGLEAEMHAEALREKQDIVGIGIPSIVLNYRPQTRADLAASASKLVPTETMGFIEALRAKLVVVQAGAMLLTGLTGNVSIPKMTGGSATWEGENDDNADAGASFGEKTLSPNRLGAYQNISKQLLMQSPYNVEQILRNDLLAAIQIAVDVAAINGSTPEGILNTTGIGSVVGGDNGLAPTWQNIIDLEKEVAVDNADLGRLAFITNPKVRAKLRNTSIGTDQRMVWPETGNTLMGYPALVSTSVPSNLTKGNGTALSAIIFGNFNDLIIGQFGAMDIVVDPYTLSKKAQIALVINSWWDVEVRHAESFAAMKDAVTT